MYAYKIYKNAWGNKWNFSIDLNVVSDVQLRMSCGRLFHNVGAALENERSPIEINLVRDETKVSCADDREPERAGV